MIVWEGQEALNLLLRESFPSLLAWSFSYACLASRAQTCFSSPPHLHTHLECELITRYVSQVHGQVHVSVHCQVYFQVPIKVHIQRHLWVHSQVECHEVLVGGREHVRKQTSEQAQGRQAWGQNCFRNVCADFKELEVICCPCNASSPLFITDVPIPPSQLPHLQT